VNVVVVLVIVALALLTVWLLSREAFRAARHRIDGDLQRLDEEHPRRHLRSVDE
jgi:hypothetical protein